MSRQTIATILFGSLLAFLASRMIRSRNKREMIRWTASFWRGLRRNMFFDRIFSKAMSRQWLRRFQLVR